MIASATVRCGGSAGVGSDWFATSDAVGWSVGRNAPSELGHIAAVFDQSESGW